MNLRYTVCTLAVLTLFAVSLSAQSSKYNGKYYKLPANLAAADFLPNTVCFKLQENYRGAIHGDNLDLPALEALYAEIGGYGMKLRFPTAQQPVKEANDQGIAFADLTLIYEFRYSSSVGLEEVINRLYHLGVVQWAEPHFVDHLFLSVNDADVAQQWHINKISCPAAWDITQGDADIVIGIIDSGTDTSHEDLQPNFHYNADDPVNGVDDDNNGYTDDNLGWDFVGDDNDPQFGGSNHGVHVAGCASPATNNGVGVAGPGFNCSLLPVKTGDGNTIPFGYEGITYAADMGAHVINCSWGGTNFSNAGQEVITYATINQNSLVVAAAGNDGVETAHYPSSFQWALSVAATDITDNKSSFSSYHSSVDVSAPGSNIYATFPGDNYGFNSGTSMASPVAAGAAALVKAKYPFLNAIQVGEQLRATCDDIYSVGSNGFFQGKLGKGRINLATAVGPVSSAAVLMTDRTVTDGNDEAFVVNDTLFISGVFTNYLAPTDSLVATLSTSSPYVSLIENTAPLGVIQTMQQADNAANPFKVLILPNAPQNESAEFTITIDDGTYSASFTFNATLNVDYVNITVNEVHTSITSKGIIGFNDFSTQLEGLGFRYIPGSGENLLFDGGLMIGANLNGSVYVSDHVRGEAAGDPDSDFTSVSNAYQVPVPVVSDIDVEGSFDDSTSPNPLQVRVNHKAFAWNEPGKTKYVIVEYTIVNENSSTLEDLYAGIFTDWDIQDFAQNKAATDLPRRMGYCYNTNVAGFYAGVQLVSDGPFLHYAVDHLAGGSGGADLSDGYTAQEKYTTMSNQRLTAGGSGTGNDVFNVVSSGPFQLAPGDSVVVAFALIGGDDLEDIQESANDSYEEYTGSPISSVDAIDVNGSILRAPVPNPASNTVRLSFALEQAQSVNVELINLMGETVQSLSLGNLQAGEHSRLVDTQTIANGVYVVRLTAGGNAYTQQLTVTH